MKSAYKYLILFICVYYNVHVSSQEITIEKNIDLNLISKFSPCTFCHLYRDLIVQQHIIKATGWFADRANKNILIKRFTNPDV